MVEFPIDLILFGHKISSHLIFELLAFIIGFQYYLYLKRNSKDKISSNNRLIILLGAAFGALIGSRFIAALVYPDLFFNPPSLLYYYTSKTIVGGLIGGLIGVELIKKLIGEKQSSGDLMVYPLILAIILGRIGCLLTGVYDNTVGIQTDFILGFDQGDGLNRHPTSLYEIFFLGILWITLKRIEKSKKLLNGDLFKIFLFSYLFFRFLIDFIKPYPTIFLGLGFIQISCLLTCFYYLINLKNRKFVKFE